jgi:hypothetical protein
VAGPVVTGDPDRRAGRGGVRTGLLPLIDAGTGTGPPRRTAATASANSPPVP